MGSDAAPSLEAGAEPNRLYAVSTNMGADRLSPFVPLGHPRVPALCTQARQVYANGVARLCRCEVTRCDVT